MTRIINRTQVQKRYPGKDAIHQGHKEDAIMRSLKEPNYLITFSKIKAKAMRNLKCIGILGRNRSTT